MATPQELRDALIPRGEIFDFVLLHMVNAGRGVVDEDDATAGHADRLAFARKVFRDPIGETRKYYPCILADPNVLALVPDGVTFAAVGTAVGAVFPELAEMSKLEDS